MAKQSSSASTSDRALGRGIGPWDDELMVIKASGTVDDYIGSFPKAAQTTLNDLRECLLSSAPEAVEEIKWSHPSYVKGTILFAFAGFARHANFYCTPSTIHAFADELASLTSGKSSVQCPYGRPIPVLLFSEMAAYRIREYEEHGTTWM